MCRELLATMPLKCHERVSAFYLPAGRLPVINNSLFGWSLLSLAPSAWIQPISNAYVAKPDWLAISI